LSPVVWALLPVFFVPMIPVLPHPAIKWGRMEKRCDEWSISTDEQHCEQDVNLVTCPLKNKNSIW
jgi:hypothetical protein